MAQAAKKKLVVAGGNGFLGSRICKSAVARGWDVTSIRCIDPWPTIEQTLTEAKSLRRAYLVISLLRINSTAMVEIRNLGERQHPKTHDLQLIP